MGWSGQSVRQEQPEQVRRPLECGLCQESEGWVVSGRCGRLRPRRGFGPSGQQGGTRLWLPHVFSISPPTIIMATVPPPKRRRTGHKLAPMVEGSDSSLDAAMYILLRTEKEFWFQSDHMFLLSRLWNPNPDPNPNLSHISPMILSNPHRNG